MYSDTDNGKNRRESLKISSLQTRFKLRNLTAQVEEESEASSGIRVKAASPNIKRGQGLLSVKTHDTEILSARGAHVNSPSVCSSPNKTPKLRLTDKRNL